MLHAPVARSLVTAIALIPVVLIAVSLSSGARPASAADAQIVVSLSNTEPTPLAGGLFLVPGGAPVTLYIWAKDAYHPTGVAAFNIGFHYPSRILSIDSIQLQTAWLTSTGRIPVCNPVIIEPELDTGRGRVLTGCSTLSVQNQLGAQGTGLLANIVVRPTASGSSSTIDFAETFLVSRGSAGGGSIVPPAIIPATVPTVTVVVGRCGDVTGNGIVTITDILTVARRFGSVPGGADWNPIYDLNENRIIDIQDVLITASQFGRRCTA